MKSVLRPYALFVCGIGMGLLLAGIVLPSNPGQLTQRQLEDQARALGMVYRDEVVVYRSEQEPQKIEIPEGISVEELGDELEGAGIIGESGIFVDLVNALGLDREIVPGSYDLKPGEDLYGLVLKITGGKGRA